MTPLLEPHDDLPSTDRRATDRSIVWDALVIGAGPAGTTSAWLLARAGLRTLLVEAKAFPRHKICGGCLSERGLLALEAAGLSAVLEKSGARRIDSIELRHRGKRVVAALPPGLTICRADFDAALAEAAERAGATVVTATKAQVVADEASCFRRVVLSPDRGSPYTIQASLVLACDGLGAPSLSQLPEYRGGPVDRSRVGIGAIVDADEVLDQGPRDHIVMAVGDRGCGYVGLAPCGPGHLTIAAALDRDVLSAAPNPGSAIATLLEEAGIRFSERISTASWRGTRGLTCAARQVASRRLLVLGDAASYVEPFTGEGMAAALESALAASALAIRGAEAWDDGLIDGWRRAYRRQIVRHQTACRVLAWALRHPLATRIGFSLAAAFPPLSAAVASRVGGASTAAARSAG